VPCRWLEKVRTASSLASPELLLLSDIAPSGKAFRCGKTSAIGAYDKNEAPTVPVRAGTGGYLGQTENRFAGGNRAYNGVPGSPFGAGPNQRSGRQPLPDFRAPAGRPR